MKCIGRHVMAFASIAVASLVAASASAQARQGELERRSPKAVKSAAFSLLVPLYEHTTLSEAGWRDEPRTQTNRLGFVGSVVAPIGQTWGWRALLGGGWSKRSVDGAADPLAFDDKVGDFLVGASVFRRDPSFGAGGISYLYRGRTTDFTDGNRRNRLGIFGEFYTESFDFGIDFGYAFGETGGVSTTIGGQPFTSPDREFDGFVLEVDARWYATDRVSAVAGLQLEVQTDKFSGSGTTVANFERTSIGPNMTLTWLPPLGFGSEKGWLVLEGSFSYQRLKGSIATGGIPVDEDRNQFGAGASVRVQLPRVASLKELLREY
jgi:hypothetical protein